MLVLQMSLQPRQKARKTSGTLTSFKLPEGNVAREVERKKCKRCEAMIDIVEFDHHQTNNTSMILPFLYLGGERNAHNLKELTVRTNIGFILNVTWEAAEQYPDQFKYKRVTISDKAAEPISDHFEEVFEFIEIARKDGTKNVLVHCVQGISRSATMVIAYLMWSKRISFQRALQHVVKRRAVVNPNPGFRERLQMYEKQLGLDVENNDNVLDPDFDDIEL